MEMGGRAFSSNSYRYNFNGKELDQETGTQDYGFRIYNPSIAKFLSVDPLTAKYPYLTPYAFAENDVIRCVDLDGKEKWIVSLVVNSKDPKLKGESVITLNLNKEEWSKGKMKYEGETTIYAQFQRPEEAQAEEWYEKTKKSNTTGMFFKYKPIKPKFNHNSSDIKNKDEINSEMTWIAERLKNNVNLKIDIKANLGYADKDGNPMTPPSIDDKDKMDGKLVTNRDATVARGNAVKNQIVERGANSNQIDVKPGQALSGAENRNATIEFK